MKLLWIIGGVFFVAGIGMLFGGVALWRSHAAFRAHALSAQGVVTDFTYSSSSNGGGTYAPVVAFTTRDGREVIATGSVGSGNPSYRRGDHVGVLYDAANPEKAHIDSFMENWFGTLMLCGMGSVFASVGGGLLGYQLRQRKVRGWLKVNGMRVQAKFEGVEYDTSLTVNDCSPWRLNCQWRHPATGKVYLFRSDPIWFDPTEFVQREQLDVLVNADNPKQYQVDTSFLPERG